MICAPTDHREHTDPRKLGTCVICGVVMPERTSLPEHVRHGFDHFINALEQAGVKSPPPNVDPAFDYYQSMILHRVERGQRVFGERWRDLDLIPELFEELADAHTYAEGERAKGNDDAGYLAKCQYFLYEAFKAAYLAHVEREKP